MFFSVAEGNLSSLTSSERSQIAENRQVMKAYLISKLVAPKYRVEDGKINMQKNVGHLDRFEHFHRQEAMFQLVFNGQIAVDTRATKEGFISYLGRATNPGRVLRGVTVVWLDRALERRHVNEISMVIEKIENPLSATTT